MKNSFLKNNLYLNSYLKRFVDIIFSATILIITSPLFVLISIFVLLTSGMPVFFLQSRAGKKGKAFKIIKFRTMIHGAEKLQNKYRQLNESDGVVFKIHNDPRFTKFGKVLSNTGLDELPQFLNVLKGEMSIVGPRPLPIAEAKKVPEVYKIRENITPGITSIWVTEGSHNLSFTKWMKLDKEYIKHASFIADLKLIYKTLFLLLDYCIKQIASH